jgi:CBS domain-containing protein
MRDERSGCALLTRDGKLAGIFTERDLVLRVVGVEGALDQPVSDWMTTNPDRVHQRDPVLTAIRLMRRRGYRNVPVVDEADQVVGCVRHKDIVDYIAEVYPEQVLNLPPDPDQVILEREGG